MRFLAFPIFLEENIVDVAVVNQRRCLEESGNGLKMFIKPMYVALACGKLVLQKIVAMRYNLVLEIYAALI